MTDLSYYPPIDGSRLFINPTALAARGVRGISLVNQCQAGNLIVQDDSGRQYIAPPLTEVSWPTRNSLMLTAYLDTPQLTGQLEVIVSDEVVAFNSNQLASLGGVGGNVRIATILLANFPPVSPQDGQLVSLILPASYDPITGKQLRILCEYDVSQNLWHCHGKMLSRYDSTHTFAYTGAGAGQDPSPTLTGVAPITVPRAGLYRVQATIVGQDTNVGGGHDTAVVCSRNGVAIASPQGNERSDSQAGIAGSFTDLHAFAEVQCAANDTLGMLVSCGVNGINFLNAALDIEAKWIT